jgi:protease-4
VEHWGEHKRIALIPVLGEISGGKSREGPFSAGEISGAETVVRALKRAEEDPQVAAIVLRVDSPGGDGLAADLMYRAVLEAKKKKPVVASMGDLAASGGYYASMGADEVFASPTTLTGSIGVFAVKPAVHDLASKLGLTFETIKTAPLADILGQVQPWTKEEQAAAQRWVDSFYDDFITEVSRSRRLSKEQVDAIARGRVWSGEDAKARGLVDSLGGLLEAIDSARRRAGLVGEVDLEVFGEAHGLLSGPGGEAEVAVEGVLTGLLGSAPARAQLPPPLKALAAELGVQAELLYEPGVKAMMPFMLKVE